MIICNTRIRRNTSVTSKGQVTIPVEVRRALGIQPHDRIEFQLTDDGSAIVRKAESVVQRLFGAVPYDGPPLDVEKMIEEAQDEIVADLWRDVANTEKLS